MNGPVPLLNLTNQKCVKTKKKTCQSRRPSIPLFQSNSHVQCLYLPQFYKYRIFVCISVIYLLKHYSGCRQST